MTLGSQHMHGQPTSSTLANVEDSSQPDWLKLKSLREIEMLRATKKEHILHQVLQEYVSGAE